MTRSSLLVIIFAVFLLTPSGTDLFAGPLPELPQPGQALSPDQLDGLLAPVALYPDPLLSQILVASTYPLELVQASQWLKRNPGLTGAALTQAAGREAWDPSIQALVIFPGLLKRLIQDITWTTNLGNALLSQQDAVMDAAQRMRFKAEQLQKLSSTDEQRVITTSYSGHQVITVDPPNAQIIYLPDYDPVYVWGPPLHYPYARWSYPRGYSGFGTGIRGRLYFGGGWGGWSTWDWQPDWLGHGIIVNNSYLHGYNSAPSRSGVLNGQGVWTHDPLHRRGTPYPSPALADRYREVARQRPQQRAPAAQAAFPNSERRSGTERVP